MAKTREKILEAAWKLFAEKGFEAVSVRDVTNAAKVNLASVSYHFNGKDGLIQEIVSQCLVPMNRQRVRLLQQAGEEAGNIEKVPLDKIIEAYVRPVVHPEEYASCPKMIAQLVARSLINESADVPKAVFVSFRDVYQIFSIALASQFPDIDASKAVKNFIFATGAVFMFHSFSGLANKATEDILDYDNDKKDFLDDAIKFCTAGFKYTCIEYDKSAKDPR